MSKSPLQLQIEKCFNLLVEEFIHDPAHKDIAFDYQDNLGGKGNVRVMGHTNQYRQQHIEVTHQTINGRLVPGSKKKNITYTYKYTISFLNNYENEESWRGTVCHEFTHLYLFSTIGDHDHDNDFYSHMEQFEEWLDQKLGWKPRKDKSGDKFQHTDWTKKDRKQEFPDDPLPSQQEPTKNTEPWWQNPIVIGVGVGTVIILLVLLIYSLLPEKKSK